jgi:hypothetical protein
MCVFAKGRRMGRMAAAKIPAAKAWAWNLLRSIYAAAL